MKRYLAIAVVHALAVALGVSMLSFVFMRMSGDPVMLMLPPDATHQQIEDFRNRMGFNDSLAVQYVRFLGGAVKGDFGQSLRHQQPSMGLVLERLPATMELAAFALGSYLMALIARLTRSGMLEVLGQDYVRTARAKGLPERLVVWRHALRNTLIPLVTVVGLQIGELLGGTVVIETVFAWPGVGRLVVQAVFQR